MGHMTQRAVFLVKKRKDERARHVLSVRLFRFIPVLVCACECVLMLVCDGGSVSYHGSWLTQWEHLPWSALALEGFLSPHISENLLGG